MQDSIQAVGQARPLSAIHKVTLVIGGSLFVALCARLSLPLPFTPVPLTLANLGVLIVGLTLGSRAGFAALALYLAEGAMGLPVFSVGMGGIAQLFGPTGGYLMAYPFAAFLAGWIAERGTKSFIRFGVAAIAAEAAIFAGGLGWLAFLAQSSAQQVIRFGLYPFVFAEVIKILVAAGGSKRLKDTALLKM
jgi:biotin transport system substrate-specific component